MGRTVPPGTSGSVGGRARIVERPDGFYWLSEEDGAEYGPFPTLREASADMQAAGDDLIDSFYEPGESLEEAEDEIGISSWIDPDTGQPAEESIPRTEDH